MLILNHEQMGSTKAVRCELDCCRFGPGTVNLPAELFSCGEIAEQHRNSSVGDAYISPCGSVFCHMSCYVDYVED